MKKLLAVLIFLTAISIGVDTFASRGNYPTRNVNVGAVAPAVKKSKCVSINGLPDPVCTPGVVRTTDRKLICSQKTDQFRPSTSYTNKLKKQSIIDYGYADKNLANYEEDHLISLELGGDGYAVANLWAEPHNISQSTSSSSGTYIGANLGSLTKDQVENLLHKEICNGKITPQEAQRQISTNWELVKPL